MKTLHPYLTFDGQCEEALRYYADVFSGQIRSLQRFAEAPVETPASHKGRVMHAEFQAQGFSLMASDCMPGTVPVAGSMVTLSVTLTDMGEQERIWDKLCDGGRVRMDLQETFWGATFGMVVDRFGIPWMLNCELATKA